MAKQPGASELLRQASQTAKRAIFAAPEGRKSSEGIYDILSYVESAWGLQMNLFPAQRAIVKLYYHLELDTVLPSDPTKQIRIRDIHTGQVKYTLTEREYLTYLYNEGKCNIGEQDHERRQLVLAIGRRGGKCVLPDTLIPTDKGLFPIEDMGSAPEDDFSPLVTTVVQEGGKRAQTSHFYNGGVQAVFKAKTSNGFSIGGTANHRVKVLSEDGTVQWKHSDKLKVGDVAALNKGSNIWASDYLTSKSYPTLGSEDGLGGFVLPETLTEKHGCLLGRLVSGRTVVKDFSEPLRDKRVPRVVLQSPKTVVLAFLRGIFGDSSLDVDGCELSFRSPNLRLLRDVQLLLLNLGVVSSVRPEHDTHALQVLPEFEDTFLGLVSSEPPTVSCVEPGYYFDEIVEIKKGFSQVYDLTVPDGESFVGNGFTNHNTTMSGLFASYEVYRLLNLHNPQAYYGLPNGNRIQVISVATDKDQAGILFNEVAGHLAKCSYFKPYQANNTQTQVNFRTPYDIEQFGTEYRANGKFSSFNGKASIKLTFKGATGKGLRGAGNIVIILDEFAHFLDTGPASAKSIYDAVTPSSAAYAPKDPRNPTVPIGPVESRVIAISSPLGKSGKFYDLYSQAMRRERGSESILAIQAPTWEINPTVPLDFLRQKYHEDPKTFSVEYGAEFNDEVSGWIERKEDLLRCISPDRKPLTQARPRVPHSVGVDVGLVGDGTYVVITHVENGKIVLDYHEGWYAGIDWNITNPHLNGNHTIPYSKGLKDLERLDFEEISNWIEALSKRFMMADGLFDSWNGIPLEQALHNKGLKQFKSEHFTQDASSKIYQTTKLMMYDGKLDLYDTPKTEDMMGDKYSLPIAEILKLKAKQISKNIVKVEAPRGPGFHDDFSDAFVRSVWLSYLRLKEGRGLRDSAGFQPERSRPPVDPRVHRLRQIRAGHTQRIPPMRLR